MKALCRLKTGPRVAVTLAALLSVAHDERNEASIFDDEWLVMVSHAQALPVPDPANRSDISNWLKFDTDECGLLRQIEGADSMFSRSALSDDQDDQYEDDDDIGVVPDPGWADAEDWLSDHPEIAVVTEGVDKWCDDDGSPVGLDLNPEFYAGWGNRYLSPVQWTATHAFLA